MKSMALKSSQECRRLSFMPWLVSAHVSKMACSVYAMGTTSSSEGGLIFYQQRSSPLQFPSPCAQFISNTWLGSSAGRRTRPDMHDVGRSAIPTLFWCSNDWAISVVDFSPKGHSDIGRTRPVSRNPRLLADTTETGPPGGLPLFLIAMFLAVFIVCLQGLMRVSCFHGTKMTCGSFIRISVSVVKKMVTRVESLILTDTLESTVTHSSSSSLRFCWVLFWLSQASWLD